MKNPQTQQRTAWTIALIAVVTVTALVGASPAVQREVIPRGVDLWTTAAGQSYTSFAAQPLPAGFFCAESKPFAGTIKLRGERLTVEPADGMGNVDTIVARLDDAVFDRNGVARTRLRLLALSLASLEPVATECGAYDVAVRLEGEQPTTEMKIVRTSNQGGTYQDALSLRVKVLFRPVAGNPHPAVALARQIDLGPGKNARWTYAPARRASHLRVDTNGDHVPDALLPPPTDFAPGIAPAASATTYCQSTSCHFATGYDHAHCVEVQVPCDSPTPTPSPSPTPTPPVSPTSTSGR